MSGDGKESSLPPVLPEEEDLPPGVRRHNRCHSSSSSDSEDEGDKKIKSIDVDSSDSDSDKSDHDVSKKDEKNKDSSRGDVIESAKSASKEKEILPKTVRSRSRSDSRSKSRSRSPSPKRRRSSDKSRRSRSRSRDRRHRRDKKHRSHRSRSKERRRSRDRHRHKKDRRRSRSRSRSRDRRDRRYSHRSSHDRERRRRSRSRERRDSRSPSPHDGKVIKFGNKVIKPGASFGRPSSNFSKPVTFKEKMRQQLIKAIEDGADTNEVLANKEGSTICTQSAGVQQQVMPKPKGPPVPLMDTILPSTAGISAMTVTASEAAMQSMLALQKEATEKTGIEIPKYYNPAAINPMKYAEQVQKRKLLWSKAKDKDVNSQWHATSLSGDADDKSKEKFRKLMGIKNDPVNEGEKEEKQKQLFDQLNKEYEFARMATHTHRGIGLGFSSSSGYPQPPSIPTQQPPQPPTSTG